MVVVEDRYRHAGAQEAGGGRSCGGGGGRGGGGGSGGQPAARRLPGRPQGRRGDDGPLRGLSLQELFRRASQVCWHVQHETCPAVPQYVVCVYTDTLRDGQKCLVSLKPNVTVSEDFL